MLKSKESYANENVYEFNHAIYRSIYKTIIIDQKLKSALSVRFPTVTYKDKSLNVPKVVISLPFGKGIITMGTDEFEGIIKPFNDILSEAERKGKLPGGEKIGRFSLTMYGNICCNSDRLISTIYNPKISNDSETIAHVRKLWGNLIYQYYQILNNKDYHHTTDIDDVDYYFKKLNNTYNTSRLEYVQLAKHPNRDYQFLSINMRNNDLAILIKQGEEEKIKHLLNEIVNGITNLTIRSNMVKGKHPESMVYRITPHVVLDENEILTDYVILKRGIDSYNYITVNTEHGAPKGTSMQFRYNQSAFDDFVVAINRVIELLSVK